MEHNGKIQGVPRKKLVNAFQEDVYKLKATLEVR